MSDHANTIRQGLASYNGVKDRAASAALDALLAERQQAIEGLQLADRALQIVRSRRSRFAESPRSQLITRSAEEIALDEAVAAYFGTDALAKLGEQP